MKKTRKWPSLIVAAFTVLSFGACTDWGQMDPPAGNQIYPKLEQVTHLSFDDEELDPTAIMTFAYPDGEVPVLAQDEALGQVLHMPGGYARIFNPLQHAEDAVSLSFWVKQELPVTEEDGEQVTKEQDLTGALFSFENENATSRLFFTANGWLCYEGVDGAYSENNPADVQTGMMTPGEWHFVAVSIHNNGYFVYVDGMKKIDKTETNFDCSKMVQFMAKVPYIYIGYGSDTQTGTMWIDDVKVFRNKLTKTQWERPNIGGGEDTHFDYILPDETPIFTVGAEDNSTGWWTAFSNYYRIPANTTMRFRFENHTSGGGNWNNWNLALSTDAERNGDGYAEYFVIRSDLYGWGDAYNGENFSNTGYGDWDQFRADMEGAIVDVTIRREGAEVYVTAVQTSPNGTVYQENFHATCGDGSQVVRAFFICDGSHQIFDKDGCGVIKSVPVTIQTIGAEDNSTGWWTAFSDYFSIPAENTLHLNFENHTSGGGNWNNWNLALATDAERGGDGYAEYFVIRSDLYGWGDAYNGENFSNTGYGDWDQFRADMEGANVEMTIQRKGSEVYVTAVQTASNGTVYQENFHATCGDGSQVVRAFLICDGSHQIMKPDGCYLFEAIYK